MSRMLSSGIPRGWEHERAKELPIMTAAPAWLFLALAAAAGNPAGGAAQRRGGLRDAGRSLFAGPLAASGRQGVVAIGLSGGGRRVSLGIMDAFLPAGKLAGMAGTSMAFCWGTVAVRSPPPWI